MRRVPMAFWVLAAGLSLPVAAFADSRVLATPLFRGVVFPETDPTMALGTSVAGIGDLDGDGIADFAIGDAPWHPRLAKPSQVFIVLGRKDFPPVFELEAELGVIRIRTRFATFGTDVLPAGDADGDGLADLWIHQPAKSMLFEDVDPHLYLLYGARGLPTTFDADAIGTSVRGAVFSGWSLPTLTAHNPIASLGDFNGDGRADVALGQPIAAGPWGQTGMVAVLFGTPGIEGSLDVDVLLERGGGVRFWGSPLSDSLEGFGSVLASAGDVNGDGLSDLIVGDPKWRNQSLLAVGRVHVIYGASDYPAEVDVDELGERAVTIEREDELSWRIENVFGGWDLDGDGRPEFGWSHRDISSAGSSIGHLFVVRGGPIPGGAVPFSSLLSAGVAFEVSHGAVSRTFGLRASVVPVPDEDGDGRAELFVGQVHPTNAAFVLPGCDPPSAMSFERPIHELQAALNVREGMSIGNILASAGDVNGDGYSDYLLGKPDAWGDPTDTAESRVFLVFGGFELDAFTVREARPLRAPTGRSAPVTISGTGFGPGVQVFFGDWLGTNVDAIDPHTLTVETPVVDTPAVVPLRLVRPDSRETFLGERFSFYGSGELAVRDVEGLVRFQPGGALLTQSLRLQPEVLGDLDGDGIEEFALCRWAPGDFRGAGYVLKGGRTWGAMVSEAELKDRAILVVGIGQYAPRLSGGGDLDGDGRGELLVAKPAGVFVRTAVAEFAAVFRPLEIAGGVDLPGLFGHPQAAYFSSLQPLGFDVWNVGDFDGDGAQDLMTLEVNFTGGQSRIVIVRGPIEPGTTLRLEDAPAGRVLRIQDWRDPDHFVYTDRPGAIGDFNGDGLADVGFNLSGRVSRAVVVLLGHPPSSDVEEFEDLEKAGLAWVFADCPSEYLGFGNAGDIDGDGLSDLLVFGCSPADDNRGCVGVLLGRRGAGAAGNWKAEVGGGGGFLIHGEEPLGFFGLEAWLRGDVDGSGTPDLVVGSPFLSPGPERAVPGSVIVVHDVGDLRGEWGLGSVPRPVTAIEGAWVGDQLAYDAVRALGDQDSDGLPELLVEAWPADSGGTVRGISYLLPGRSVFGPPEDLPFVRGDADGNRALNLSDPIVVLGALFLGSEALACEDAADGNDDGALNLTDAIYVLSYLFLGGPPPPAPFPDEGPDPTPDALSCASGGARNR